MKVHAIERLCIAAGRCTAVAADIFELDEDGFVLEAVIDVPPDREDAVMQASLLCPGRAIVLLEEDSES